MVSTIADKPERPPSVSGAQPVSFAEITTRKQHRKPNSRANNTPIPAKNVDVDEPIDEPHMMEINQDPEEPFVPVKTRRNRHLKPTIIGARETDSAQQDNTNGDNNSQFVGSERRQWVYVGRVANGTSVDTVAKHVKVTWNIPEVACVSLANNDDWCSFKVGVKESFIPSLMDAAKWPKHVAVRKFIQFPRNNTSRQRPSSGNFQPQEQSKPPT